MRDLAVLFLHLLVTIARLAGPGGVRSVVGESVLVKHQLLILNRSRKRSPNLCCSDRRWQANLQIFNIREIKTVPYVPRSHAVVERLIGTVRREYLDRLLFWTGADLEQKLVEFQQHYNEHRTHAGRAGRPPVSSLDAAGAPASLCAYRWQPHCRGLYHTPRAA